MNFGLIPNQHWYAVKDGNSIIRGMLNRHYSNYKYKDGRRVALSAGPGEKMLLLTNDCLAGWIWRKFISSSGESGVNCAMFRNEGYTGAKSSELIQEACALAWARWPGERLYTYVNPSKVISKNPGFCFLAAGWKKLPYITKVNKLWIYEVYPVSYR